MKINVSRIAKLSNLTLLASEKLKLQKQLEETIDYVEELEEVNTKNVEPTNQVTGLENITREDLVKPSLSQGEAISNAKSSSNGFFKVGAILTEDK